MHRPTALTAAHTAGKRPPSVAKPSISVNIHTCLHLAGRGTQLVGWPLVLYCSLSALSLRRTQRVRSEQCLKVKLSPVPLRTATPSPAVWCWPRLQTCRACPCFRLHVSFRHPSLSFQVYLGVWPQQLWHEGALEAGGSAVLPPIHGLLRHNPGRLGTQRSSQAGLVDARLALAQPDLPFHVRFHRRVEAVLVSKRLHSPADEANSRGRVGQGLCTAQRHTEPGRCAAC